MIVSSVALIQALYAQSAWIIITRGAREFSRGSLFHSAIVGPVVSPSGSL